MMAMNMYYNKINQPGWWLLMSLCKLNVWTWQYYLVPKCRILYNIWGLLWKDVGNSTCHEITRLRKVKDRVQLHIGNIEIFQVKRLQTKPISNLKNNIAFNEPRCWKVWYLPHKSEKSDAQRWLRLEGTINTATKVK